MKEYIICAAIWYKELSAKLGKVSSAFLTSSANKSNGIVICGRRHYNIIQLIKYLTDLPNSKCGENVQGFLTNTNRFVDRFEAFQIAKQANQLLDECPTKEYETAKLFTEDIYKYDL